MRSRSSLCRPVIIAIATMSASTPTVTPSVETNGNDRDERLAAAAEQIAQRDLEFEWHVDFGRICGNRMTSRIDRLSVSSITRRSMPTPSPAVGGSPYSSART